MPPAHEEETQFADQEYNNDEENVGPTCQIHPQPAYLKYIPDDIDGASIIFLVVFDVPLIDYNLGYEKK